MAHFVLEYSDNIEPDTLALGQLFERLHDAMAATGIFPLKGIRSRAYAIRDFRVADGNPGHILIHLSFLIGAGRSEEEKALAATTSFSVLSEHFDRCFDKHGVAMSFELRELERVYKYNRNNVQDHMGSAT